MSSIVVSILVGEYRNTVVQIENKLKRDWVNYELEGERVNQIRALPHEKGTPFF